MSRPRRSQPPWGADKASDNRCSAPRNDRGLTAAVQTPWKVDPLSPPPEVPLPRRGRPHSAARLVATAPLRAGPPWSENAGTCQRRRRTGGRSGPGIPRCPPWRRRLVRRPGPSPGFGAHLPATPRCRPGLSGATGNWCSARYESSIRRLDGKARDLDAAPARALAEAGADLVRGDFDDGVSVAAAAEGGHGVFAVPPAAYGPDTELEYTRGAALVDAAVAAGVQHFVFGPTSPPSERSTWACRRSTLG